MLSFYQNTPFYQNNPFFRDPYPRTGPLMAGLLAAFVSASPVLAQQSRQPDTSPTIVITHSRIPTEVAKVGQSIALITAEEIESQGHTSLNSVLRAIPGLAMSHQPGGFSQLRIRGAESNHLLVLIDGVPANDAGSGEYLFGNIPVHDIAHIEIVRGPQSGVHGSNAHAGVLNIVTQSGRGYPTPQLTVSSEAGTDHSARVSATLLGSSDRAWGKVSGSFYKTRGYNLSYMGAEKDGDQAAHANVRAGVTINDHIQADAMFRYRHDRQDGESGNDKWGRVMDAPGREFDNKRMLAMIGVSATSPDKRWTHRLQGSLKRNQYAAITDGASTYKSKGRRERFNYTTTYRFDTPSLAAKHFVSGYAGYQRESFSFNGGFGRGRRERRETSLAGEYRVDLFDALSLNAALRHDWNDQFKNALTWRLSAAYSHEPTGTRLHASVGKGVTNPTFFEQFGYSLNFVGNPDLKPEHSLGWDAGLEQSLFEGRLTLGATLFQARLKNAIAGAGTSVTNLQGTGRRKGFELSADWQPTDALTLGAAYTYTDSKRADGRATVRRPRHVAKLTGSFRFLNDKAKIGATLSYTGSAWDTSFPPWPTPSYRVKLKPFVLLSARASYRVRDNLELYVRGTNLLNTKYEENYGYRAPGFTAYAGLTFRFGGPLD